VPEPECTLRAAIQEANTLAGQDTITFNIPGSGVPTIRPNSALPPITQPVVIDGTTQPNPGKVELDGSNAVASASGLAIWASTTVKGLDVVNFPQHGISISDGTLTFEGASNPGSQISGNGGAGIEHSGTGTLFLVGTVDASDNCGWGIASYATDPDTENILVTISGRLTANNNGRRPGCVGGGIYTYSGLFGPASAVIEAKNNGSDGIRSSAQNNYAPDSGMWYLGSVQIENNKGFGIHSFGTVMFQGTEANPSRVNANGSGGIYARYGGTIVHAEVNDNCGWGIQSPTTPDIDSNLGFGGNVKVNNNGQGAGCQGGGILIEGVIVSPAGSTLEVANNNGDGIQLLESYGGILYRALLQGVVKIKNNQGFGINAQGYVTFGNPQGNLSRVNDNANTGVLARGVTFAYAEVLGNGGWGVDSQRDDRSNGNVMMQHVKVSNNAQGGIRSMGALELGSQDVEMGWIWRRRHPDPGGSRDHSAAFFRCPGGCSDL